MRSSADISSARIGRPRRRAWLISIVVGIIVFVVVLRWFTGLYVQSLWYSSIHEHEVFSTILATKVGLFLVSGFVFFAAMWGNLLLCNRLGPNELFLDAPEDELVRRFQAAVRPYAGRLYALLSLVLALIAASTTLGRWQEYLLFANAKDFHVTDPIFGKDLGFYVFRLPFLTFVVDWVLGSLLAILAFTVVFHYLNGGIRAARVSPRVAPGVKVHLSVLLALLALAKAAGYLLARWHMVTSTSSSVFEGAGYTDIHARLPALMLLFWLCLLAAVILLVNIWQRGWTLPIIAVGLWAFVALIVGVIYPAILQAVKVTPAQSTLEAPYIARNIDYTRMAYGLDDVKVSALAPSASRTPLLEQPGVLQSLEDIRQWDPSSQISQPTFQQLQGLRNYYSISTIGEDRYMVHGKLIPVDEGMRELNSSGVPNQTWVNEHLSYTHGLGIVMIPSNVVASQGQPVFVEKNVPPVKHPPLGFPQVTTPGVYYGLTQNGYVVVDTHETELNYDQQDGTPVYTKYTGGGGVTMGGFLRRLLFAIHFSDVNLLLSNEIDPQSRIIYMRNVVQVAQQAAPFLSIDDHPYAAIVGGHLDWVLDAYTTTDEFPYSQNANTQLVPSDNGLPSSYNYVRNSVKVIVDAYTGQVSLYDVDPYDPILQAWKAVFPNLFLPIGDMTTELRDHLRYPEDLFSIQSAVYGRYHLTIPSSFYSNSGGWSLSPTNGAGPISTSVELNTTVNKQGYIVSQSVARMDPLYQIYALPGTSTPQFTLSDAYVAATSAAAASSSTNPGVGNLTGVMVALSDPTSLTYQKGDFGSGYGHLQVYEPASSTSVYGPLLAESKMVSSQKASSAITLLNQHGSSVYLGNVLMVPINGSMLYACPLYVTSNSTNVPYVRYLMTFYKNRVGFAPTLDEAVGDVLGGTAGKSSTSHLTPGQLLALALQDQQRADVALVQGHLGEYQKLVNDGYALVTRAEAQLAAEKTGATTTSRVTVHAHARRSAGG